MNSCEMILKEIQKINQEISNTIKDNERHEEDSSDMKSNIKEKVDDVEKLNNEAAYQLWVSKINALG